MLSEIKIEEAFSLLWPIIDVRSPAEFEHGHIPGAINIPLFSNDERAHVGTVYKQQSKERAIKIGLEYVTPKLESFINNSQKIAPLGKVIVHCWRGGMRSQSFAKHLVDNGFSDVGVIIGGYKAFRNHVLVKLETPVNLRVLGGYSGSGKTHILNELKKRGKQVIDLDGLANHKGSAFGGIGQAIQPTVEQFENNLFNEWKKLNLHEPIWVEDESHNIGRVKIPMQFFKQMRNAKLYFIDIPKNERAKHLVTEYASCNSQLLAESIQNISRRLGGVNVKNSIELLDNENYYEVAKIALNYYDKSYLKGMNNRNGENVINIALPSTNHYENALEIENSLDE
ncbi:MAG: tRNA 2-selenouridine(34) synthase MnmH [Bacteroidetes bacterium]|nr:tRNA 2-selenouridine(34) synthase MnmH [Bacteroidota bacterium]